MRHRSRSNLVSADVIDYLARRRQMSQNEIADLLGVDKSFISRARRAERELSVTQLQTIADRLGVPLGAMLIDSQPPASTAPKENRAIIRLCDRLMRQADEAIAILRRKN